MSARWSEKSVIAAINRGEPCPMCDKGLLDNGYVPHDDDCLFQQYVVVSNEYDHCARQTMARGENIVRLNNELERVARLLTEAQARCDEAEHRERRAKRRGY